MATPRLLPVQQNYLEGMKRLIDLYYSLKTLPQEHWFSDEIFRTAASVFGYTVSNFSRSVVYWDGFYYHLRYGSSGTSIRVKEFEFEKFLKIFDDLRVDIANGKIAESYRVVMSTISIDYAPVPNGDFRVTEKDFGSPTKKILSPVECEIFRQKDPWYVNGFFDPEMYDRIHGDLSEHSAARETFQTDFDFDSHLIYTLTRFGPEYAINKTEELITSPRPDDHTSFSDVVRYILAKFYTIFGSLDRIKVCKEDSCGRLFVERKLGSKQFCSNKCRMKYNADHQPERVKKCRDRQNQWLRNQLHRKDVIFQEEGTGKMLPPPSPNHVQKKECDECRQQMKTGLCEMVKSKNAEALQIVERYPRRKKSP